MSAPRHEQEFQRELAVYRYVAALDAGDPEAAEEFQCRLAHLRQQVLNLPLNLSLENHSALCKED